jgi:hypothetical protein
MTWGENCRSQLHDTAADIGVVIGKICHQPSAPGLGGNIGDHSNAILQVAIDSDQAETAFWQRCIQRA